jgi:segregation and condensation protein A
LSAYRVNLDVFAGPLDLLLYLIRKEEVDIYDIPIARITDQYIQYIEMLKNLDIDLAGDFLVMAATLMAIKSSMLLPKAEPEGIEAEDFEDPRAELIRQLLEYKKFKDAANLLDACAQQQQQRLARPAVIIDRLKESAEPEVDLDQVSVWDLLGAFDTILQSTGGLFDISHIHDDTPIDLYQIELLHRLQTDGAMPFARIFEGRANRLAMIGLFMALLELIRDGLVGAEQHKPGEPIYIAALTDEPAEQAVQKALIAASAAENAAATGSQEPAGEPKSPAVPITEFRASAGPQGVAELAPKPQRQNGRKDEKKAKQRNENSSDLPGDSGEN